MQVFKFANPDFFWALLLIPLFIVIFVLMIYWKKAAIKRFGDTHLIRILMPDMSKNRLVFKFVLSMLAFTLIIIGLANPQIGSKLEKIDRKGIDLVIAVDVSESMLAQDIKPNRLQRARQAITRLVDELGNDRIGIVVFAGRAYTQLPITTDYAAVRLFVSNISTESVPVQGTAIADAINLSIDLFDESETEKAIIIITDGEDHEGDVKEAAQNAVEKNIRIFTVGMGLPEGAPIPIVDRAGNQQGFKKDRSNNTVISRLDENMLKEIASAGNGQYVRANNTQVGLRIIFEEISQLEKTEFESRMFTDYEDRFQYFLAPALLILLLEFLIFERRSSRFRRVNIFGENKL
ncbi:MAG: VWA domain-containing protein [Bacteroidales bacterium]|nr:VWA domain-containing protein [Bacteroidales bacterium]